MNSEKKVRIDKWLWAVRIFKTRAMASDACARGKVIVNKQKVKPSRMISNGERVVVIRRGVEYVYEVLGCIEKRVGAKIVEEYRKDLTPEEEIERARMIAIANRPAIRRNKGTGRPTKKDRRQIERFMEK